MGKHYLTINLAIFFWLFALVNWYFDIPLLAGISGILSLIGFIIFIKLTQDGPMFRKNTSADIPTHVPIQAAEEKKPSGMEKHNSTVIAEDVYFEGNITSAGHVYIYGRLKGNIDAEDGLIKIIQNGLVEGNITCRELIVDGNLSGHCISDSLSITENGGVTGTVTYNVLTIKKGGVLSGQVEVLADEAKEPRLTGNSTASVSLIDEIKTADVTLPEGSKPAI